MPKNKGKGGKNRRRGKNENDKEKRELDTIDLEDAEQEDLEYAQIITAYGGCKFDAVCYRPTSDAKTDWGSEKRVLHVRGKLRKKQWVNVGDIVICSKREFEPAKGDIIQKYTSDQARELKAERHIPPYVQINTADTGGDERGDDPGIEFGADDDTSEEDEGPTSKREIDIDDI